MVISKAVAELERLIELSLPVLDRKGIVIAMKGANVENEIRLARATIEKKGLRLQTTAYRLPFSGMRRRLVVLEKKGADRKP